MGQNYSTLENESRKTIEFNIFDKSFLLIEKYVKNTNGLRNAFKREYELALNNSPNGYLNWHKVMPKQLKGIKGKAYLEAVKTVGQLLQKANDNYKRCGGDPHDRHLFTEVYDLVNQLIDRREKELSPEVSCFCCILSKGHKYKSHEPVINAWKRFRH